MDFDSQMILIYCICDDCVKALNVVDDPLCKMSTAEIMTFSIASAQFFYGNFRKTSLILKQSNFMKQLLSESQLNRRWHAIDEQLWYAIFYLLSEINKRLRIPSKYYAVDSSPCLLVKEHAVIVVRYIKENNSWDTVSLKNYITTD